jgi:predicted O-methyltransferase YrrM
MSQDLWTAVDDYIEGSLAPADPALESALADSRAAGLMAINITAAQGKLLHILARSIGARAILEIGTLGGYSTIWLARALAPGGRLVSLEIDPKCAGVALRNIDRAGLSNSVEIHLGPALESLQTLSGPFDLVFIDANKDQNPEYFARALELTRPGGLIVVDNVVRDGAILQAESGDAAIEGVRRLYDLMATEARIVATAIQTVGAKGYDGFSIALVKAAA